MYQRLKLPNGIVIVQAENNHVSVRENGQLVFHAECHKDLTADELIEVWEMAKEVNNE